MGAEPCTFCGGTKRVTDAGSDWVVWRCSDCQEQTTEEVIVRGDN